MVFQDMKQLVFGHYLKRIFVENYVNSFWTFEWKELTCIKINLPLHLCKVCYHFIRVLYCQKVVLGLSLVDLSFQNSESI